jgi:hypothetical protein
MEKVVHIHHESPSPMHSLQSNNTAVFLIKLFHTLVFLVESAAILYIVYSGITNTGGTGLVIAIALVLAEVIVFVANGLVCPLTNLARRMGDATGNDFIADIFLPARFARLIPPVCGGLALIGLLLVGLRVLTS